MTEEKFDAKAIIFHEGDSGDNAYIIRSGTVEILKHGAHGELVLATLEAGEVFGEMSLFQPGSQRSATARAVESAVVDVITTEQFVGELNSCPPRILPIILTVIERLRSSNQRLSQKEEATVILDSDIESITVTSLTEGLEFSPITTTIARLPFRIGGYSGAEGMNRMNRNNHLNVPCQGPPLTVSRQHCQVEIIDNGIFLRDLGSRFTTIVNGAHIGRGKGIYRLPLQKGKNEVILGGEGAPTMICITCE